MTTVEICLERNAALPPVELVDIGRNEIRLASTLGPLAGRLVASADGFKMTAGEGVRVRGYIGRSGDGRLVIGSAAKVTTVIRVDVTDQDAAAMAGALPAVLGDWVRVLQKQDTPR